MANLIVQIDAVATLREAAGSQQPEPVSAAVLAELGGADGIAVHLREDRKHTQDRDVRILRKIIQTRLILKMAATSEMLGVALNVKPDIVILVPEEREGLSSEGGLDLMVHKTTVAETVGTLKNSGIPVGVLVQADVEQIKLVHQSNADLVEIHTGAYCEATTSAKRSQNFSKIVDSIKLSHRLKMEVFVGSGIDYVSIKSFSGLTEISCFCIGHGIVARAVLKGMESAVRDMRNLIGELRTN
jgi:pyridoxine 5-phosphate synthase